MIAILTDFNQSEYLGVMKGVIYSICPNAKIVDLCNVQPHNIKEAAWILLTNYSYFPKNSIFLCVVDPGVGGRRNAIAIKTRNYYFVGPDNGLLYPAAKEDGIETVVKLSTEKASKTFHGRDVFAPAAAKLEKGLKISTVGKIADIENKLEFYLKGRTGEVVRIDNFGNVITNLAHTGSKFYSVRCGKIKKKLKFYETYESAPSNRLFLIVGSAGTFEISIKNARAVERFRVDVGNRIEIK